MSGRFFRHILVALGVTVGLAGPAHAASVRADFNGDGYSDLAIGAPAPVGGVNVFYGSPAGLTSAGSQFFNRDSPGIPIGSEDSYKHFGISLAPGDFNGDGFCDLAIGVYEEKVNLFDDAGSVIVLQGSASGLTTAGSQLWTQDSPDVPDTAEYMDKFGTTVTTGDFDGDGYSDLAVGVPFENIGSLAGAGVVHVFHGSSSGLTSARNQLWSQDSPGVAGAAEAGDIFGLTLVSRDFNGDGRDDLAIGAPGETVDGVHEAGVVNVLYGTTWGLTAVGSQLWGQDSPGVPGTAQELDRFGGALAAADFDRDGWADLAIGVPTDTVNGVDAAGAVNVLYGSASGLTSGGSQIWSQDSPGVPGTVQPAYSGRDDWFGSALATGDFDGDGRSDLAIGVQYEDVDSVTDAGAVNILYGSASGLASARSQLWSQEGAAVPGTPETDDRFASALAAGDFDGDGRADLAVGVPYESVNGTAYTGAVNVFYSSASGLTAAGSQIWSRVSPGVPATVANSCCFGFALSGR